MRELVLTPDNPHLSTLTKGIDDAETERFELNCTHVLSLSALPEQIMSPGASESGTVDDLVRHSIASSTRVAYASDLKHFAEWGGVLPASPEMVAAYIAAYAGKLSVATITRRIATLSKAHETMAGSNPCQSALVKATLQGLRRKHGTGTHLGPTFPDMDPRIPHLVSPAKDRIPSILDT